MYIKESLKNKFDIIYTPNNYKLFYISHHKLIRKFQITNIGEKSNNLYFKFIIP